MTTYFNTILAWTAKNERRLGAVLFAFGFLTDFFTFGILPVEIVNIIFLGYLALATVSALGAHAFAQTPEHASWWRRTFSVLFPLGVQYAFGGLLSGFVVFYTAHSVLLASWPFLVFVFLVYVGNEYFRMYKHYLVFQTGIFFFSLYAYVIFGLPLAIHTIGPWVFLFSTALALLLFGLFLYLLRLINRKRFQEEVKQTMVVVVSIVVLVSGSYFAGVIPPIPLIMKEGGVYHSLTKTADGYRVTTEEAPAWWDIRTPIVHSSQTAPLYAFSAVGAPTAFSSTVVHRWERNVKGKWVTESRIAFPISGGREGGYRGYSVKDAVSAGQWRVSVETPSGQVIGRIRFDVEVVQEKPSLTEKIL